MSLSVDIRQEFEGFSLDVAFEAPPGVTMLFGRSGSGKTTVMNAVAGLMRPGEGRIAVADQMLFDSARGLWLPPHKRGLGVIFQEGRLFPHLTVRQNLSYGRWFAGAKGGRAEIDRVVEMLGIGPLLGRRPAALSGGEKQRVAIGRALLAQPRLILADEPLAALDESRKQEILPYFERLRDEVQVPILYVSHSPAEVARLATTVVALEAGKVSRVGPATEVMGDPQVTPLGAEAAGAVLDATVLDHIEDGLSELEAGSVRFIVPHVNHARGARLRVHVDASDVMLATVAPHEISALNVLPARVTAIRLGNGPGALVQLDAGGNTILARVTRRSVDRLGLVPGREVYAVLKAVSVTRDGLG